MIIKTLALAFAILASIGAVGFWQWDEIQTLIAGEKEELKAQEPSGPPVIKVLARPVQLISNDRVYEATGTGRSKLSIQVYSPVSEEIQEILFEAGDLVEKDQILYRLEDDEERLAVRLAEVQLDDARRLLERYQNAGERGAVPQSEVDAARAEFDSAEVRLEQAKLAVEERQIRAPFKGIVGVSNVDPGDRVDSDMMLTSLDDRSEILVDFEVPEQLLSALVEEKSREIRATSPAYPGRNFTGHLVAQESRVDADRRTLLLRAAIDNEDDALRQGMSFSIRWNIPGQEYPTVPEISLQWGRDGSFVWIARDGTAEKVMARVVARTAGLVLLEGELSEDELVIVEGVQRLRPGAKVEVLGEVN